MTIRAQRFPEYDLMLHVISAPHSAEEALQFFEGGDSDATRWLTYFDPTVDMSGIDVASIPKIKRVVAAKLKELFGDRPHVGVIVCGSAATELFFQRFWRSYLGTAEERSPEPAIFCSLEAAYDWLKLPEAARKAVAREIDAPALAH